MTAMTHDRNGRPVVAKVKRSAPERTAQIAVKRWIELVVPGAIVAASKNETAAKSEDPMARARFYQARATEGVVSGFPDLSVLLPGGRTLYIEMKSDVGRLSDAQRALHERLRAMGHCVGVARSIEDARAFLIGAGVALIESRA